MFHEIKDPRKGQSAGRKIAPEEMASVLRVPNQLCYYVFFPALFVTYFVHNISATVSYGKKRPSDIRTVITHLGLDKELLDIRTAITHLGLDKDFFNNKQDSHDILQTHGRADIPVIHKRKRRRYRGRKAGCLVRTRRRGVGKLPLPSILLANVQSLDNKLDEVRSRISYQQDIKNCNILCFTE